MAMLKLPDEILCYLLAYAEDTDLQNLALTCKHLRRIVFDDHLRRHILLIRTPARLSSSLSHRPSRVELASQNILRGVHIHHHIRQGAYINGESSVRSYNASCRLERQFLSQRISRKLKTRPTWVDLAERGLLPQEMFVREEDEETRRKWADYNHHAHQQRDCSLHIHQHQSDCNHHAHYHQNDHNHHTHHHEDDHNHHTHHHEDDYNHHTHHHENDYISTDHLDQAQQRPRTLTFEEDDEVECGDSEVDEYQVNHGQESHQHGDWSDNDMFDSPCVNICPAPPPPPPPPTATTMATTTTAASSPAGTTLSRRRKNVSMVLVPKMERLRKAMERDRLSRLVQRRPSPQELHNSPKLAAVLQTYHLVAYSSTSPDLVPITAHLHFLLRAERLRHWFHHSRPSLATMLNERHYLKTEPRTAWMVCPGVGPNVRFYEQLIQQSMMYRQQQEAYEASRKKF